MASNHTGDKVIKSNPFNQGYYNSDELREFGFASVGTNVQIAKNCTIIGLPNITIGDNVRIDGGTTIAAAKGSMKIGSYIHIGGSCFLACAAGIELADFVGLSQAVRIYSASDDYSGACLTNPTIPVEFQGAILAPVRIGRHVIVGTGSIVLPGVTIEDGSSVGALSVVSKSLAGWGVYVGTPVHRLKDRSKKLLEDEAKLLGQ